MREQIEGRVVELKGLLEKLGRQDIELAQRRQEGQVAACEVMGALKELERLLEGESDGKESADAQPGGKTSSPG